MLAIEISFMFECPYCGKVISEDADEDSLSREGAARCPTSLGGCGKPFWLEQHFTSSVNVRKIAGYGGKSDENEKRPSNTADEGLEGR